MQFGRETLEFGIPEFEFASWKMEFADPEMEFGTAEIEFAGQKMEFGVPEMEFASPEFELGSQEMEFGSRLANFSGAGLELLGERSGEGRSFLPSKRTLQQRGPRKRHFFGDQFFWDPKGPLRGKGLPRRPLVCSPARAEMA